MLFGCQRGSYVTLTLKQAFCSRNKLQVKRVSYVHLSTIRVHSLAITLWTKAQRRLYQRTDSRWS